MSTVQISINPYTLKENYSHPTDSPSIVKQKIISSKLAYTLWSKETIESRALKLKSFRELVNENKEELAELITKEIGCPITQTIAEVTKSIDVIDYYLEHSESYLKDEIILDDNKTTKLIRYDPYGTMLHISPYNYPLYLAIRPIIPSLLAGNSVLLKTPSQTPLLALRIEELIAGSNLPKDIFQILYIAGADTEVVIEDENIDIVTLIGSEKAGSNVAMTAGKNLKKSLLELGGSDPMLVFQDADLGKVTAGIIQSRIRNAGQSCNAIKRVLVHSSIKDELTSLIKTSLSNLVIGNPIDKDTNFGPMANSQGMHTAQDQIQDALTKGAKLIYGGNFLPSHGLTLEPTLLTDITSDMLVFTEEVFAPVIPIIEFNDLDEAIMLANNSKYGLGASVWTSDKDTINSCISRLETGNVAVNSIVRGDPMLPYGGIKKSGYGREFGKVGIQELCNIKSVVIQK